MKKIIFLLFLILIGCASGQKSKSTSQAIKTKYNILFIAVDDLKPYINSFGYKDVKTPNLDKLAKTSTIFNTNYCQQAVCAPSRASLLTGLSPDKTQVWDLQTLIRDKNPDIITLPQFLKANGYTTAAMGKIFDQRSVDKEHDAVSWSVPYKNKFKYAEGYEDIVLGTFQSQEMKAKFKELQTQREADKNKVNENQQITFNDIKVSTESADVPDDAYFDGAMTNYAIQELKSIKNSPDPFFMAIGFHKPHLPFVAPKKYWDLYNRNEMKLAQWHSPSIDGPDIAYHSSGELRSYKDIAKHLAENGIQNNNYPIILSEGKQRELIHGYYASISYMDAQVGRLINALKAEGLDKNTILVLWGDHGWHFGDHNLWAKHSNFEQATKAPLIFSVPGLTNGKVYIHPTSFVDIFPTICELNGIIVPSYLDGKSLVPAMKDNSVKINEYAVSQYPRNNKGQKYMGYSIRTERFRYTEWLGPEFTSNLAFHPNLVLASEMYDLKNDPNETINIVEKAEMKEDLKKIQNMLQAYYNNQEKTAGTLK